MLELLPYVLVAVLIAAIIVLERKFQGRPKYDDFSRY